MERINLKNRGPGAHANPVQSSSRPLSVMTFLLGLFCILLGLFLWNSLRVQNGERRSWVMVIATSLARTFLDAIDETAAHMQP